MEDEIINIADHKKQSSSKEDFYDIEFEHDSNDLTLLDDQDRLLKIYEFLLEDLLVND